VQKCTVIDTTEAHRLCPMGAFGGKSAANYANYADEQRKNVELLFRIRVIRVIRG